MNDRTENILLVLPGLLLLAFAFLVPIGGILSQSFDGPNGLTLDNFLRFYSVPFYQVILWRTIRLSIIVAAICAAIGFPYAYIMARGTPRVRRWLLIAVMLPLMTSVIVRTFGWMVILSRSGLLPELLRSLGFGSMSFMYTETAIVIGLVQVLLPFMVLTTFGVVTRIDIRLEEAARTMGCSLLQVLRSVVLPLALPGVLAGSLLVFTLSASSFVTPNLLGGSRLQVLATSVYNSITQTLEWQFAAAQAVLLFAGVLLVLIPYGWLARASR
jgi:putative spermidine/putrescine transport system permease protein